MDVLNRLVKQNHMRQCVEIGVDSVDYERENNHVQLILAFMYRNLSSLEAIIKP